MVLEAIFTLIKNLLMFVFDLLPDVPELPTNIMNSISNVFNTIFDNIDLLGLFVRIDTIKILVPLVIVAANFEHIYHFIMWIVKKIPLSID